MTLYRIDEYVKNSYDEKQEIGYCYWVGGPTISNIKGCRLFSKESEERRAARITGECLTYYSLPASISFKGKTVKGVVTCEDGIWIFNPFRK